jgi:DNA-binding beta-propeller fold protein YncE
MHPTRTWLGVAAAGVIALLLTIGGGQLVVSAAGAPVVNAPATVAVGQHPRGLTVTNDGQRVLVVADDTVTVVDATTTAVLGHIRLGTSTAGGVAVTPDGRRALVASLDGITMVDLATNLVVGSVKAPYLNRIVHVDRDGNGLLGSGYGDDAAPLVAVDLSTGTGGRVGTREGPGLPSVAVTPDGARAYLSRDASRRNPVRVLDLQTGAVAEVPDTLDVSYVAMSPDGRRLYALGPSALMVVDTDTDTVVRTISRPSPSGDFVVTPDSRHLAVIDIVDDAVDVLNAGSGSAVARIQVGSTVSGLAVAPDGNRLYVLADAGLSVLDISTLG